MDDRDHPVGVGVAAALRTAHTTQRWDAYEQMGLRIAGVSGTVLRDITVDGSAAAGIYVGQSCCTAPVTQSSDFLIDGVTVTNTRADGIHITGGSHDGTVQDPTVTGSGDDGVAVVSYAADGVVCNHITIDSPTVTNNTRGRGVSVVGGRYITYRNVHVTGSDAAAIYIATEGAPFHTADSEHITVDGATLQRSNTDARVGHGAIMIYGGNPGTAVDDVAITGVTIDGTRSTAPWQVGVRSDGAQITGVSLDHVAITGNLTPLSTNLSSGYRATGWTVNGNAIPDVG